ncbi:MAG: hypothetical protein M1114_03375 [Candidatus Dependentiae bacterium]|nr:hypothetical protein [Candidatus Dependentiae bacterium]
MKKNLTFLSVAAFFMSVSLNSYAEINNEESQTASLNIEYTIPNSIDTISKSAEQLTDDFFEQANKSKDDLFKQLNESLKKGEQQAVVTGKKVGQLIVVTGISVTAGSVGIGLIGAGAHHVAQQTKRTGTFTIDTTAGIYFASGALLTTAGFFGIKLNDTISDLIK